MEILFRKDLGLLLDEFKLPRIVCEEGVAEGRLSRQICEWGVDRLYLIDLWETIPGQSGDGSYHSSWHDNNYKEAMERIEPWKDKVTVLRGFTKDMIPQIPGNSLGLVYIDAAHDYDSVIGDLMLSYPKVVTGGIISGHDYLGYPSVYNAVNDFCKNMALDINIVPDEEPSMASFWLIKK
jgi:hypothetical protein